MPTLRLTLATVLAALAASPAHAELTGWRFMSGDLQATTSACIGSNESPVCAAETMIACVLSVTAGSRGDSEACRAAGEIGPDTLSLSYTSWPVASTPGVYVYLLDVWRLTEESAREFRRASAGDIVVDIYTGACAAETEDPRACSGLPFQDQDRVDQCGDVDPHGFLVPDGTMIYREAEDGWRVTGFRDRWMEASNRYCDYNWRPERWRRDASDLLR